MKRYRHRVLPGAAAMVCLLLVLLCAPVPLSADTPPAPDLVIELISWTPEVPSIGATMTFTLTAGNIGDSSANTSKIDFYIDDTYYCTCPAAAINVNKTASATVTWQARPGTHTVRAVADAGETIAESDESNNEKSFTFSVLAPDLVIESITWSPENPSTGDTVDFTVTVKNQGNLKAGYSQVDFSIDGFSRGYRGTLRLGPGDSITEVFSWRAISGTHMVGARADILDKIAEGSETNNCLEVTCETAAPDLVVDAITWTPASPTENTTVTFSVTVNNTGTGKAESSRLAYYIDGTTLNTAFIGSLSAGASVTKTVQWTADRLSRNFTAVADALERVPESDESNNGKTVALPSFAPDLIVEDITYSPASPLVSHSTAFYVIIKNQGKSTAGFSRIYLHIDGIEDYYAEIDSLAPAATVNRTFRWTPQKATHVFEAVIDEENYIPESNEANNTRTETISFTPFTPTADLVIQSIGYTPENPTSEDIVTITATIKNQGSGEANPSHIAYYIGDLFLTSAYIDSIKAGGTATSTYVWDAGGEHILTVVADINNGVPETNETNNEKTINLLTSAPDLTVQSIAWSPLVPAAGSEVTCTIVIKNQGDEMAGSSYVTYYVDGLSRGNNYLEGLEAGGTATRTFVWKAQSASHVFTVAVDTARNIVESDESNNERTLTLPAPDLVIDAITWLPQDAVEDDSVTFNITLKNRGVGLANDSHIAWYIDGTYLASIQISDLYAGDTANGTYIWTAEAGNHTVMAAADGDNGIIETDEENNTLSVSVPVSPPAITTAEPAPTANATAGPPVQETTETPGAEAAAAEIILVEEESVPDVSESPDPAEMSFIQKLLYIAKERWIFAAIILVGAAAIIVLLRIRKRQAEAGNEAESVEEKPGGKGEKTAAVLNKAKQVAAAVLKQARTAGAALRQVTAAIAPLTRLKIALVPLKRLVAAIALRKRLGVVVAVLKRVMAMVSKQIKAAAAPVIRPFAAIAPLKRLKAAAASLKQYRAARAKAREERKKANQPRLIEVAEVEQPTQPPAEEITGLLPGEPAPAQAIEPVRETQATEETPAQPPDVQPVPVQTVQGTQSRAETPAEPPAAQPALFYPGREPQPQSGRPARRRVPRTPLLNSPHPTRKQVIQVLRELLWKSFLE